ncbi:SCP2 sterol-binding domain-containing protein [Limibacter armeniacum]|uniref:SCP2 sterol-binding domain-containing protein n=1 Tax=Limibacter armeniacum TaxID=466084 RepID=UPI002FE52B24
MEQTTIQELINSYKVRFLPEKAAGKNFTMHFDIQGEGAQPFSIQVKDGAFTLSETLEGDADCKMTADIDDYIKIETGKMSPTVAVFSGKVKVSNALKLPEFLQMFRGFVSVKKEGLL